MRIPAAPLPHFGGSALRFAGRGAYSSFEAGFHAGLREESTGSSGSAPSSISCSSTSTSSQGRLPLAQNHGLNIEILILVEHGRDGRTGAVVFRLGFGLDLSLGDWRCFQ